MTTPTDPYAVVRPDSEAHRALQGIGWAVTDLQDGWAHMEPPPKFPNGAKLLAMTREALPDFEWSEVGAGIGPTVWGFRGGVKVAITCGSRRPGHPWMAFLGPADERGTGPWLGDGSSLSHKTFEELIEAVPKALASRLDTRE